ncbi:hypothetical protein [Cupriavidus basilensis]|uniref:hypothetical protein n=1 Tax=Cupriavidus basilensis TaxID=68895 RepID=UPI000750B0E1|nr:hypothetical protein [Cupriavidus basilensis]
MLEDLHVVMAGATWPARFGEVFLAGGEQYRRVMRAAVTNRNCAQQPAGLIETRGGIGEQRSQLGKFLRYIALEPSERIGVLPNGTPCYRRAGRFVVGDRVRLSYSHLRGVPDKSATIRRIFAGPRGLTAEADVEEPTRGGGITVVGRWVCLRHL